MYVEIKYAFNLHFDLIKADSVNAIYYQYTYHEIYYEAKLSIY